MVGLHRQPTQSLSVRAGGRSARIAAGPSAPDPGSCHASLYMCRESSPRCCPKAKPHESPYEVWLPALRSAFLLLHDRLEHRGERKDPLLVAAAANPDCRSSRLAHRRSSARCHRLRTPNHARPATRKIAMPTSFREAPLTGCANELQAEAGLHNSRSVGLSISPG